MARPLANPAGFGYPPGRTCWRASVAQASDMTRLWQRLRRQAEAAARREPLLAPLLAGAVLERTDLADVISHILAGDLATPALPAEALAVRFLALHRADPTLALAALEDLQAVMDRDPATTEPLQPLIYYKGFKALQAHRLGHALWRGGARDLALWLQSRNSAVFTVDIHPAARIGTGVLIDHAHGIVIGETSVVGNHVSMLHSVTLGGTGKSGGDRHPKIGDGVLIGAGAKVLGNITVGRNSRIAAGSVVLEPVPTCKTVAGIPARIVGDGGCDTPAERMDHAFSLRPQTGESA